MNLKRTTLIASGAAVLLLAGIAFAYTGGPGSEETSSSGSPDAASPEETQPKVLDLLDDLQNGDGGGEASDDAPVKRADVKNKMPFAVRGGDNAVLGSIAIPEVGLTTKYYSGVIDEIVTKGPGHWPGTPLPGGAGNSVFAGHRTTFTKPFADLDLLDNGDVIKTTVGNNKPVNYKVYKTTVVPEAEYVDFVLKQPRNERARTITLLACTPEGQRTHRIVVQARTTQAPASTTQNES